MIMVPGINPPLKRHVLASIIAVFLEDGPGSVSMSLVPVSSSMTAPVT